MQGYDLFIAEKPSLGKEIAAQLGKITETRRDYLVIDGGRAVVSWGFGHVYGLAMPEAYVQDGNTRTFDSLPVLPQKWLRVCTAKEQASTLNRLIKKAGSVINAGDPDREGQLIIDVIIEESGENPYSSKFKRIWLRALNEPSIKKALADLRPNSEYANYKNESYARQRADWLLGLNGSMVYSLVTSRSCSIGRVRTPTLAMVVNRDREIANFKPHDYFVPWVVLKGKKFTYAGAKREFDVYDQEGRIIDPNFGTKVREYVEKTPWVITQCDSEQVKEAPPLPHSLDSIQQHMNKTLGFGIKKTLDICQELYEKHKITSYPRTDCRYLPESYFDDRKEVLRSIYGIYKDEISKCSATIKSKAFNDKHVGAHHGIIPTGKAPDLASLSADEKAVFDVICRFYIAQFYPDSISLKDHVTVTFGGVFDFTAFESTILDPQWKALMGKSEEE